MTAAKPVSCTPERHTYVGFALISCSMLAFEVLLTRVLSIRFGYHLAFAVISLALFGLTAGAVFVHFRGRAITASVPRLWSYLALSTLLFAGSLPLLLAYLARVGQPLKEAVLWDPVLIVVYLLASVPFFLVGVSVCILLTTSRRVARLYAADLVGAGLGGAAIIALLSVFPPSAATLFLAAASALAGWFFSSKAGRGVRVVAASVTLVLAALGLAESWKPSSVIPALRDDGRGFLFEKWNSYSRVTVLPLGRRPFGWGYSAKCGTRLAADQKLLWIDRSAATPITEFDGDLDRLWHLDCDVTNAVYTIRRNADVLVVGLGGGRDLLAALRAGSRSVEAVEMNDIIIDLLEGPMAAYSGNLTRLPGVRIVNDEARAHVRSMDRSFDVIQASMVDTFAASTSGAYSLTENNLYTVEAFVDFLKHLNDDGVLTVSRWYQYGEPPFEMLRIVAVARAALERLGIEEAASRIAVLAGGINTDARIGQRGTGTLLVKKEPFTVDELSRLRAWAAEREFRLPYTPGGHNEALLDRLLRAANAKSFFETLPLDVSPTTDDSPFFFLMRVLDPSAYDHRSTPFLVRGYTIMEGILLVSLTLSLLVILVPVALTEGFGAIANPGNVVGGLFFLSIGVAFMLLEIAQIQRLTILLGHPSYSLSVVLSALLVGSGIGSYLSDFVLRLSESFLRVLAILAVILLTTVFAVGFLTSRVVAGAAGFSIEVRILASVLLLVPMGMVLGVLFPLGMSVANRSSRSPKAWFWALNGAASVVSSVLAVYIAARFSISAAFAVGVAVYGFGIVCLGLFHRVNPAWRAGTAAPPPRAAARSRGSSPCRPA